jgi:hypothetical protein
MSVNYLMTDLKTIFLEIVQQITSEFQAIVLNFKKLLIYYSIKKINGGINHSKYQNRWYRI